MTKLDCKINLFSIRSTYRWSTNHDQ